MKQGIDMTVNRLPARTWNWLKMNESSLSDIGADGGVPLRPELSGDEISWENLENVPLDVDWAGMETGMGPDMDRLGAACGEVPKAVVNKRGTGKAFFALDYEDGKKYNRVYLYAEAGSTLDAIFLSRSAKDADGLGALQVKIYAGEGAKVRLYEAQLLGEGFTCLNDIGGVCMDNASVELVRLELGSGKLYAGGQVELIGKKSSFEAHIGYSARENQHFDMNYTARHRGKKTESRMEASGVLDGNASKLFRGTIDFVPGCAGSKGNEREDVLLLGENVVNQTIPLILCAEEDVEGNHGASMGRLDDQMLFYLESRGISKEDAERMMARARIDAVCSLIPEKRVADSVQAFLGEEEEA